MRITSCAFCLASASILAACSGGDGNVAGSSNDDPSSAQFDGVWQRACALGDEGHSTETVVVEGGDGVLLTRRFEDALCTLSLAEIESPMTLDFGDPLMLPDGSSARALDIAFVAPVTYTALDESAAVASSNGTFCEFDRYAVGVSVDIGGCDEAGEAAIRVDSLLPQIAAVETADGVPTLFLGDTDSEFLDATEPRPSQLDRSAPLVRLAD